MRSHRLTGALSLGMTFAISIVAGCGNGSKPPNVTLPSSSSPASAPATSASPSPASPEDAATAAYTAFWPTSQKALEGPPEQIRTTLAQYSTGAYLNFQVRNAVEAQENHHGPWGEGPVVHVTKVQVKGGKATLWDCQDAHDAALADTRTHQIIPGTRGTKNFGLIAELLRGGDGQWRVSSVKRHQASCS